MAIKRFGDYEKTKAYGDIQALPKGGYVLKIMDAVICENRNGQYIKISCDVAEGEYRDFTPMNTAASSRKIKMALQLSFECSE